MFHPKKQLGQNFLKNPEIAKRIVSSAEIKESDTVIEVGSGTGILTEELVKTGAAVFAIEKDYKLITNLQNLYENTKNIKIVHQDALWFDLDVIASKAKQSKDRHDANASRDDSRGYKVVANIPYNITSPLIRKFIEGENKPELMVLMVQKEVAERITAKPGDSNRGYLTLIVEFYADAEILFEVSRKEFYPVPKVDSAVIKIITKKAHFQGGLKDMVQPEFFFKIVKAGFAAKRKQVHNSLAATLKLDKDIVLKILSRAKIDPMLRAEDLTLEQWFKLSQIIKNLHSDEGGLSIG